jgi:predicted metalloprotease
MLWKGRRQSANVEDQRRIGGGTVAAGGGIGLLILALAIFALGGDPSVLLGGLQETGPPQQRTGVSTPQEEAQKEFVSVVLADTEDVWNRLFQENGRSYREPRLVLFTGQIQSACGFASAAVGPFYCPEDQKIYIDLRFYDELAQRFGAPGEFAQAYVIAHEVGHHVQNQLGVLEKVQNLQRRMSKTQANQLQVRVELQADYYAGVWAHHTQKMKQVLNAKDIEDGLRAASAIGDDRLQKQAQGYVVPDAFTHGTSEQRARWFRRGWESGDMKQGDTFNARNL